MKKLPDIRVARVSLAERCAAAEREAARLRFENERLNAALIFALAKAPTEPRPGLAS